jgi:hypothetical protein
MATYASRALYIKKRIAKIIGPTEEVKDIISESIEKFSAEKTTDVIDHCIQTIEEKTGKTYTYQKQGRPRKYQGDKQQRYYASILNMVKRKMVAE